MTAPKISLLRLRQLIQEEVEKTQLEPGEFGWVDNVHHVKVRKFEPQGTADAPYPHYRADVVGSHRENVAIEPARISRERTVHESVDHNTIKDIITVASKLLGAVEGFKTKASASAMNAVTPHLGALEKALENMVTTPGSYVPVPKKEPKRVSLKATKAV